MPGTKTMRFEAAISRERDAVAAAEDCARQIATRLNDGQPPDLLFVFVSPLYGPDGVTAFEILRRDLKVRQTLGCSGGGILASGVEVEDGPALAVMAARLPGVTLKPFHLLNENIPNLDFGPREWEDALGVKATEDPHFIVLADPFSMRAEELLGGLDFAFPNAVKVGGLASGARARGQNVLFLGDRVVREGAVGLALCGNVRLEALVAQGCTPLGQPLTITQCKENLLVEVSGRKPLEWVAEIYERAEERERMLIRSALFVGMVQDPYKQGTPSAGDFLIRNIMGRDPATDGLYLGANLRQGQVVQFHVRDGVAANADLAAVLRRYSTELLKEGQGDAVPRQPCGALLFSCLGRGKHMYGKSGHDSELFREFLGDVPLSGFFCNGEIGPVGGTTYLHGFTSCFGVLRPRK